MRLSPKLFVSYARSDGAFVASLVDELRRRGFQVFLDTTGIDPGDNFVATLTRQIHRATAIVAVISDHYTRSRWAQAELYHALAQRKTAIPVVLQPEAITNLDEPLQRLLRDTQYVTVTAGFNNPIFMSRFAELLSVARRRYLRVLMARCAPFVLGGALLLLAVWWSVTHLNELEHARRRDDTIRQVVDAKTVLQKERLAALASSVTADRQAIGELTYMSQDPARSDVTRFNALALGSELRKGQKSWRWYVRGLAIERSALQNIALVDVSFLGGAWTDVRFENCTFSGVFWAKDQRFTISNSQFRNVRFFGGEMEAITAVDVAFVNTKFRGTTLDTTNFSKVRFVTEQPAVEGNPVITPDLTLLERSVLISRREPPEKGVLDLTTTGDDVIFDGVSFVDCRLEGWFRPEWFRNSSFERCELPASLKKELLVNAGNVVH